MALNSKYVIGPPLREYFVNKDTGLPLANGTLTFYRDADRITPKPVYELTGVYPDYSYTALPNPLNLNSVGEPQDNSGNCIAIYYYPYDSEGNLDLYYVVCRDEDGVEQWTQPAWPNLTESSSDLTNSGLENQISNPQFTQVFLNSGANIISVSAATSLVAPVGPDWDLVISGTGNVTVTQVALSASEQIVTNPPFALEIDLDSGITECLLRQRLNANSGLWASTDNESIVLTGTFVAKASVEGSDLSLFYKASNGALETSPVSIADVSVGSSDYALYQSSTSGAMPDSDDANAGNDGYVDIYFVLPLNVTTTITSVQVIPIIGTAATVIDYYQNTSNRAEAHMGDYYIPALNYKPIPSYLIGWDFINNPGQFGGFTQTMSSSANYLWDQTIGASSSTSNAVAKNSVSFGFQITTGAANQACYIMQYFDLSYAKRLLGTKLSVNVNGYITSAANVTMRIYLFRAASGASVPALPTTLGTIATSGVFTLTAVGWTEIPRSNMPTATATLTHISDNTGLNQDNVDYGFNGWEITDNTQLNDTNKFGIVVTFAYDTISIPIVINSISLVPGDIPTRPAPTTYNQTLLECQRFYEKSYDPGTASGTASTVDGQISVPFDWYQSGGNTLTIAKSFTLQYITNKQTIPTVTFYSPTSGSSDTIVGGLLVNGSYPSATVGSNPYNITVSTAYTPTGATRERVYMLCIDNVDGSGDGVLSSTHPAVDAVGVFHYQADARLGVV